MSVRLISPWTRLIEYSENHLNDFCLFRGLDDRWHCIGIMGLGPGRARHHSSTVRAPTFTARTEYHPPLLSDLAQGATSNVAPQKHAPFVVIKDSTYYMFFRRPPGTNLLVNSPDTFHWSKEPVVVFEENDARDACIQRWDGIYYWYYCEWRIADGKGRSGIMLRRSADLERWSEPVEIHVDTSREVKHSHLESPFVVRTAGRYWLFVRDRSMDERCVTTVFHSRSPDRFASGTRSGTTPWRVFMPQSWSIEWQVVSRQGQRPARSPGLRS